MIKEAYKVATNKKGAYTEEQGRERERERKNIEEEGDGEGEEDV